jgi:hypothetical protein
VNVRRLDTILSGHAPEIDSSTSSRWTSRAGSSRSCESSASSTIDRRWRSWKISSQRRSTVARCTSGATHSGEGVARTTCMSCRRSSLAVNASRQGCADVCQNRRNPRCSSASDGLARPPPRFSRRPAQATLLRSQLRGLRTRKAKSLGRIRSATRTSSSSDIMSTRAASFASFSSKLAAMSASRNWSSVPPKSAR